MVRDVDLGRLAVALRRLSSVIAFGVLPAVLVAATIASTVGHGTFLYDFRGDLYDAGRAIIHDRAPYQVAFLDHQAAIARAGGSASTTFAVPVYPAPALLASVPLALLPFRLAGLLFTALALAALIGGLRLLGVRDWRCYGAALLSWPVLHSLRLGQVNELLVLGAAIAWRWRDRLYPPAAAVAAVVAMKLFLWPLGAFLLFTKRWKVAVLAIAMAALAGLAAWAVIGFAGLSGYPRMLGDLSAVEGGAGISLASVGRALGVSRTLADIVGLGACAGLLALAWWWSLRGPDGEARAFGLAVMAGIVASPLVWPHYLTLVFVPIALLSPTLSPLWLVPLIAYLAPTELTHGDVWRMLPYLAIELIVIAGLSFTGPARRGGESSPATAAAADGLIDPAGARSG